MELDATKRPYEYVSLLHEEIRVMVLRPGSYGDRLGASLHHVELRPSSLEQDMARSQGLLNSSGDAADMMLGTITQAEKQYYVDPDELATDGQYDALSYVWGSDAKPRRLELDAGTSVAITDSLYIALQRFRHPRQPRNLWADSVCINQEDNKEKAVQVALMGRIYEQASWVLAWLGESQGLDWLGIKLLYRFDARHPHVNKESTWLDIGEDLATSKASCSCCPSRTLSTPRDALDLAFQGVNNIVSRPWFTRLWVVQEVLLAQTLVFYTGTHTLHLTTLTAMLMHAFEDILDPLLSKRTISSTEEAWAPIRTFLVTIVTKNLFSTTGSLLHCMRDIGDRSCSNPLDRVYALRSISIIGTWPELRPDYTVSSEALYTKMVYLCLLNDTQRNFFNIHSQTIHPSALLALAPHSRRPGATRSWPSWVLDLHHLPPGAIQSVCNAHPTNPDAVSSPQAYSLTPYHLSCKVMTDSRQSVELSVQGTLIGTVQSVLPGSAMADIPGCILVHDPIKGCELRWSDDQVADILLWARQCGNFIINDHKISAIPAAGKNSDLQEVADKLVWLVQNPDDPRSRDTFFRNFESITNVGMHPAFTSDKLVALVEVHCKPRAAWVPRSTQPLDKLCVLHGAPQAFILRGGATSAVSELSLIGDVFVAGMNDAMAMPDKDTLDWIKRLDYLRVNYGVGHLDREAFAMAMDEHEKTRPRAEWIHLA